MSPSGAKTSIACIAPRLATPWASGGPCSVANSGKLCCPIRLMALPSCKPSSCLGASSRGSPRSCSGGARKRPLPCQACAESRVIHGDTVRSEALLQRNSCAAVRCNILATQQLLASLPESGVSLLLLSSHLAAEALVAQWAASHPSCTVQVWRLPSAPRLIPRPPARLWPASPLLPGCANGWMRLLSISFLALLLLRAVKC